MDIRISTAQDKDFAKSLDKENMEPIIKSDGEKYYGYMFETFQPERCFIIEDNSVPVGFAYCHPFKKKCLDVWSIQIKKEFQRKQYGKSLMNHIIEFAKSKNLKKVMLEVHKVNTPALNFYRKYGFKELGELKPSKIFFELPVSEDTKLAKPEDSKSPKPETQPSQTSQEKPSDQTKPTN